VLVLVKLNDKAVMLPAENPEAVNSLPKIKNCERLFAQLLYTGFEYELIDAAVNPLETTPLPGELRFIASDVLAPAHITLGVAVAVAVTVAFGLITVTLTLDED
jgi:hypothetical protein